MQFSTALPRGTAPWVRPRHNAVLAGVCTALERALAIPAPAWRALFFVAGSGALILVPVAMDLGIDSPQGAWLCILFAPPVILYLVLWAAVPQQPAPVPGAPAVGPAAPGAALPGGQAGIGYPSAGFRPSVAPTAPPSMITALTRWAVLAGITGFGAVLILQCWALPTLHQAQLVPSFSPLHAVDGKLQMMTSIGMVTAGVTMGLLPLEAATPAEARERPLRSLARPTAAAIGLSIAMIIVASLWALGMSVGPQGMLYGMLLSLLALALAAAVLVPWLLRMTRAARHVLDERVRAEQRAEIAAHLHDSVLQTLTMMQRDPSASAELRRLARLQERELRHWLHDGMNGSPERDLRTAVQEIIEEVEDIHGAGIRVVTVGDGPVDERTRALLAALREAVLNAVQHGGGHVDVYVEASGHGVEAFVRDHGPGFRLEDVPTDRLGVRESIIGRMQRAGGVATVGPAPGGGTDVTLRIDVEEEP